MTPYIVSALTAYGIAYVLGQSTITLGIRQFLFGLDGLGRFFVNMMECPACLSFHLGWVGCLLGFGPFTNALQSGFFFCGTSSIIALLTGITQRPTPIPQVHFEPQPKEPHNG